MNKTYNLTLPIILGTLIEWAEFIYFAYMLDFLSVIFFPQNDSSLSLLKTYAIFAASYIMRPVGAILFGYLGDKTGRKPTLIYSLTLMAVVTCAMGCLPTYAQVGGISALFLLLCRLLQGIAVAGELNGASILLTEHVKKHKPFLASAWVPAASSLGMVIGGILATLVRHVDAPDYAWRIPFLLSSATSLIIIYMRKNVQETPIFNKLWQESNIIKNPVKELINNELAAAIYSVGLAMFIAVWVYLCGIYVKIIMIQTGYLSAYLASQISTFGQILTTILIVVFGVIANRVGGFKICSLGLLLGIFLGPVVLWCAQSREIAYILGGQLCYSLVNGMVSAPVMALVNEKFSSGIRYTGSSLSWNIGIAIFGGSALFVASFLTKQFGLIVGTGGYISFISLVSLWIIWRARKDSNLRPPGS